MQMTKIHDKSRAVPRTVAVNQTAAERRLRFPATEVGELYIELLRGGGKGGGGLSRFNSVSER